MTPQAKKDCTKALMLMRAGKRDEANALLNKHGFELKPGHALPTKIGAQP